MTNKTGRSSDDKLILQEISLRFPDAKLIEAGSLILDGIPANFVHVTMEFNNFNSPISIHNIMTRVEKNDLLYTITCGSFSSGFEKAEPVFQDIIRRFGFLD